MKLNEGKLIVICGTDGSGKGTQTKLLKKRLKSEGYDIETIDFPQYGKKSAGLVENYLNGVYGDSEEVGPYRASIFFACDRYDASFQIREWLKEGKIVICNRYVSANMGHQAGKIDDLKKRNEFLNWLHDLEYSIFNIPKPDVNILLYMPHEYGHKLIDKKDARRYLNGKKRDIHEKDLKHLKKAKSAYLYVSKKFNWEKINCVENDKILSIKKISNKVVK
ncbi:MAG: dTMP kinase, partial [Candidatus Woesearchaeota archaeon]